MKLVMMESSGAARELVAGKMDATGASSSPSTTVSSSISATAAASAKGAQAKTSPSSKSTVHPAGKGQATASGLLKGCEVFINPALDIEQMDRVRSAASLSLSSSPSATPLTHDHPHKL